MAGKHESKNKKKKLWPFIVILCLIAAVLALLLSRCGAPLGSEPCLSIETPPKLKASDSGEIVLDVSISALGEALYPAMSTSIAFDPSKLEFLGVREGNLLIHDAETNTGHQLPDWNCSAENSNKTGLINIMYLDLTGGKYAFSRELMAEEDNVVMRLAFRLRGSVRTGDVLELTIEDAVFAASDESLSLASSTGTLKTRNGRIVIGE